MGYTYKIRYFTDQTEIFWNNFEIKRTVNIDRCTQVVYYSVYHSNYRPYESKSPNSFLRLHYLVALATIHYNRFQRYLTAIANDPLALHLFLLPIRFGRAL